MIKTTQTVVIDLEIPKDLGTYPNSLAIKKYIKEKLLHDLEQNRLNWRFNQGKRYNY